NSRSLSRPFPGGDTGGSDPSSRTGMITPLLKVAWSFLKLSAHRRERAGAENSGSSSFQRSVSPLPSPSDFSFIRAARAHSPKKDPIARQDFITMPGERLLSATLSKVFPAHLPRPLFANPRLAQR